MSEHDEQKMERELAALREQYSSLSHEAPTSLVDDSIRAAAAREVHRPYRPAWGAVIGLAACIGLAVVIVPGLLIETAPESARPGTTDLVLVAERYADDTQVRRKQRETFAMRETPPAPLPQAAIETKGEASLAHEEWLAREEIAPPAGAASSANTGDLPRLAALRRQLAHADEPAWRAQLLALRDAGDQVLAQQLLEDYRSRFEKPTAFSLDDLERLNEEQINNE